MDETRSRARTVGVVVIACVAAAAALYFGRLFFVPIAFTILLHALFRPVVRGMQRWHIPAQAGAAFVVLGLVGLLVLAGFLLAGPVQSWVNKVPESFKAAQAKLDKLRKPVQKVQEAAKTIEQMTQGKGPTSNPAGGEKDGGGSGDQGGPGGQQGAPPPPQTVTVAPQTPGMLEKIVGSTTVLLSGVVEVLLLLFLMLAAGGVFLKKLVNVVPDEHRKQVAAEIVHDSQAAVVRYLVVTLLINLVQGAVVALAMWLLKMPNPILWGGFTVVLEFIPYLGATVMVGLLAMIAVVTFDGLGHILLVPGVYLVITTLQNNVVSPIAYGQRLKLNPVSILIGVLLWGFLWGVAGAFLAVPILAAVKIAADRTRGLRPLGAFLGE